MDARYTSECGRSRNATVATGCSRRPNAMLALKRILSASLAQALRSMVRSKRLQARALPLMPTPIPYFVNGQPLLAAVG